MEIQAKVTILLRINQLALVQPATRHLLLLHLLLLLQTTIIKVNL